MKQHLAGLSQVALIILYAIPHTAHAFDSNEFVGSMWTCTDIKTNEQTLLYLRPNGKYIFHDHESDGKWKVTGKTIVFDFNVADGGRILGRTVFSGKFANRDFFMEPQLFLALRIKQIGHLGG